MYHAVEARFGVQTNQAFRAWFNQKFLGQTSQLNHVDVVVAVLASVTLIMSFLSEDEPQQFFTWRCHK